MNPDSRTAAGEDGSEGVMRDPRPASSPIPFTKMHGLGNDYIYVNGFEVELDDPAELSRRMSDRHFGVGADGLVLILPSTVADLRMRMWNVDGSESEMCGNALRCIARYVYERRLIRSPSLTIETGGGPVRAELELEPGSETAGTEAEAEAVVRSVRTDLGVPKLERAAIPMLGAPADGRVIGEQLEVDGDSYTVSAVSMGNPHLVVEVETVSHAPVITLGPRLEGDSRFPRRVNVGFVEVVAPDHLRLRVWERGSGETLACGSGAAAATVAMILRGRARPPLRVELPGGNLITRWREGEGVWIEGPAIFVYDGVWAPA
jgi:diaminopimelate epimerase